VTSSGSGSGSSGSEPEHVELSAYKCRCNSPNLGTVGYNKFTCSGRTRFTEACQTDEICFATGDFLYGDRMKSCKRAADTPCPEYVKTQADMIEQGLNCVLTMSPSAAPSSTPTDHPTTKSPSPSPSQTPTEFPTAAPSHSPTLWPTQSPTRLPTTHTPTDFPTEAPSVAPTVVPTPTPTRTPTEVPTTQDPTTDAPSYAPTHTPTIMPSHQPSHAPSMKPTASPTHVPSDYPTHAPSAAKCWCVTPGEGTEIKCSDYVAGQTRHCGENEVCSATGHFEKGAWDQACAVKARKTGAHHPSDDSSDATIETAEITCKCVTPNAGTKGHNQFSCSAGPNTQTFQEACPEDETCVATEQFRFGDNKKACKKTVMTVGECQEEWSKCCMEPPYNMRKCSVKFRPCFKAAREAIAR